jgi:hypothetical protein
MTPIVPRSLQALLRRKESAMQTGPTPRFVVHTLPKPTSDDSKRTLRRFVAQVGGIENARRALDLLALLEGVNGEQRREAA